MIDAPVGSLRVDGGSVGASSNCDVNAMDADLTDSIEAERTDATEETEASETLDRIEAINADDADAMGSKVVMALISLEYAGVKLLCS